MYICTMCLPLHPEQTLQSKEREYFTFNFLAGSFILLTLSSIYYITFIIFWCNALCFGLMHIALLRLQITSAGFGPGRCSVVFSGSGVGMALAVRSISPAGVTEATGGDCRLDCELITRLVKQLHDPII